jgi:hypothetical protein
MEQLNHGYRFVEKPNTVNPEQWAHSYQDVYFLTHVRRIDDGHCMAETCCLLGYTNK